MAIHIKLIRNNIKRSSSYGKYFAKTVSQGEVTLKSMVREALLARGYDEGAVVAVVMDLEHALKVKLSEGYTVVIPEERRRRRAEEVQFKAPHQAHRLWFPACWSSSRRSQHRL